MYILKVYLNTDIYFYRLNPHNLVPRILCIIHGRHFVFNCYTDYVNVMRNNFFLTVWLLAIFCFLESFRILNENDAYHEMKRVYKLYVFIKQKKTYADLFRGTNRFFFWNEFSRNIATSARTEVLPGVRYPTFAVTLFVAHYRIPSRKNRVNFCKTKNSDRDRHFRLETKRTVYGTVWPTAAGKFEVFGNARFLADSVRRIHPCPVVRSSRPNNLPRLDHSSGRELLEHKINLCETYLDRINTKNASACAINLDADNKRWTHLYSPDEFPYSRIAMSVNENFEVFVRRK